ncbi:MAG TPA: hypothetical protein ENH84_00785 [Phycisphaerae bacterium]|nr:hypothetical protein [Phycisphaerae bacterium]
MIQKAKKWFGDKKTAEDDLPALKDLMTWAKNEGFVMKKVKIGAIEMEIEPFLGYDVPKDTETTGQSEKEAGSSVGEEQPEATEEELYYSSGGPPSD